MGRILKSDRLKKIVTKDSAQLRKKKGVTKIPLCEKTSPVSKIVREYRPQGVFRFLVLPRELRDCIYGYLLSDKRQAPVFDGGWDGGYYIYNYQSKGRTIHRRSSKKYDYPASATFVSNGSRTEMLLVNREISHEYEQLVMKHMTLHIRSMSLNSIPDLRGRIGAGRLALASRVVLELTAACGFPPDHPSRCTTTGVPDPYTCDPLRELPQYGNILHRRLVHMPNLREICFNIPYWHAHAVDKDSPGLLCYKRDICPERRHIFNILTAIRNEVDQKSLPQVRSTAILATQVAWDQTVPYRFEIVKYNLLQSDTQRVLDRRIGNGAWLAPEWQM